MTIKYDKIADAVYMQLAEGKVFKTMEINDRLIIDLDEAGNTLGIEILDASSQDELVRSLQTNAGTGFPINITENTPILA